MPADPLPRLRAQTPATSTTCPGVRNGVYTVSVDGASMTFRISTITQARTTELVGKRVISRLMSTGDWKMFAFLTETGELKLWQRFHGDTDRPYVQRARTLLTVLDLTEDESYRIGGNLRGLIRDRHSQVEIAYTSLCQVCNQNIAASDNRCRVHTTRPFPGVSNVRTTGIDESPPFEVVGSLVFDTTNDEINVPSAILSRLARSEVDGVSIR
jgi:hypothetical protein